MQSQELNADRRAVLAASLEMRYLIDTLLTQERSWGQERVRRRWPPGMSQGTSHMDVGWMLENRTGLGWTGQDGGKSASHSCNRKKGRNTWLADRLRRRRAAGVFQQGTCPTTTYLLVAREAATATMHLPRLTLSEHLLPRPDKD